ncbi:hypothetical protein PR048_006926 [Dryococelus australis]|uniref:Uncharacterized protein n=1 Tax=Dryococelus australis TaxID=614101 RepID=A0ABQ9ICW1_9NEOP|nr:hypothetical protein PR048_006926 [Dryococelus australis]
MRSKFKPWPIHSGFSHVGIVLDDAVSRWVFRGSPFPPPLHSVAAPHSPQSPSLALKTSMLRAIQISSLTLLNPAPYQLLYPSIAPAAEGYRAILVPVSCSRQTGRLHASRGPQLGWRPVPSSAGARLMAEIQLASQGRVPKLYSDTRVQCRGSPSHGGWSRLCKVSPTPPPPSQLVATGFHCRLDLNCKWDFLNPVWRPRSTTVSAHNESSVSGGEERQTDRERERERKRERVIEEEGVMKKSTETLSHLNKRAALAGPALRP